MCTSNRGNNNKEVVINTTQANISEKELYKMRFFFLALKARRINKKLKRYERAKANAIRIHEGREPQYTLQERYHNFLLR